MAAELGMETASPAPSKLRTRLVTECWPSPISDAGRVPSRQLNHLLTRLRELRESNNLTQERFAELSGISYKYYQSVEAGRKRELRLSTLERLAGAYGLEVWELLCPNMPQPRPSAKAA